MQNHIKESFISKLFDFFNTLFFIIFTLTILYPFLYMFSVSISEPEAVGAMKVILFPIGFQFKSYLTVFSDPQILTSYKNSIYYTFLGVTFVLLLNGLAAYVLSRKKFSYSKKFFTKMFLFTMLFNGGMIPIYLNIKKFGLLDTEWAIILPAVGMWYIVLMRTNFQSIPESLFESAYLDGANDWYIFFRIVIPLSKAIFATVAIFSAIGYWNNYFGPLLYITSPAKEPLTILLRRILISNEALQSATGAATFMSENQRGEFNPIVYQGMINSLKMATVFITIGPIVFIYPFIQKYFVKGVLVGSVKE